MTLGKLVLKVCDIHLPVTPELPLRMKLTIYIDRGKQPILSPGLVFEKVTEKLLYIKSEMSHLIALQR